MSVAKAMLPAGSTRVSPANNALRSLQAAPLDRRFFANSRSVACAAASAPAKEETYQYQAEVRSGGMQNCNHKLAPT